MKVALFRDGIGNESCLESGDLSYAANTKYFFLINVSKCRGLGV